MKAEPPPMPPSEYRVRAKCLLKRADFQETVAEAATRFQRLESFSGMAVSQVIECREGVKLKHALAVVALKQGYGSWDALSCPRQGYAGHVRAHGSEGGARRSKPRREARGPNQVTE